MLIYTEMYMYTSMLYNYRYMYVILFWNLCPQSAQHPLLSITNGEVCLTATTEVWLKRAAVVFCA